MIFRFRRHISEDKLFLFCRYREAIVYEKRWELLFDFIAYHSRWSELTPADFFSRKQINESSRPLKGSSFRTNVKKRVERKYDGTYDGEYDEVSGEYVEKFIRLCKEQGVEPLLINTGFDCSRESKYFSDAIPGIAASYGVPYIDFTQLDVINFRTDLSTPGPNAHVNASGAQRLTAYIGEYFLNHYDLPDHRGDGKYAAWEKDLDDYRRYKAGKIRSEQDLNGCLVLLNDDDYYTIFEVRDDNILADEITAALFENIGVDPGMISGGNNIVVLNNAEKKAEYYSFDYSEPSVWKTPVGDVKFAFEEDASGRLEINGRRVYRGKTSEGDFRIRFFVLRAPDCHVDAVKEF